MITYEDIDRNDPVWQQHRYAARKGGQYVHFIILPHAALDASPELDALVTKASNRGVQNFAWKEHTVLPIYRDKTTVEYFAAALQAGGEVLDAPVYVEVDPATNVPEGVPGATDEDDNPVTWENWLNQYHSVITRDGRSFVPTNGHDNTDLPLSAFIPVLDSLVHPADLPDPDGE